MRLNVASTVFLHNTVGQALAAFNGDPVVAYDKKAEIWTNETVYRKTFTDRTSARHVVFCYSLLDEINNRKISLTKDKRDGGELKKSDLDNLEFLDKKGASFLLVHLISDSLETILGKAIPNKQDLVFIQKDITPSDASEKWTPIVDLFLSLSAQLDAAFSKSRITSDNVSRVTPQFRGVISSLKSIHAQTFSNFAKEVGFLD